MRDLMSLVDPEGDVEDGDLGILVTWSGGLFGDFISWARGGLFGDFISCAGGGLFGDFISWAGGDFGLLIGGGDRGDFITGVSGFFTAGAGEEIVSGADDRLTTNLAGGEDGEVGPAAGLVFPESLRIFDEVAWVAVDR